MRWRGPVALVALTAGGLAGGFGLSLAVAEHPVDGGTAAPVAAQSPSMPVDPVPEILPDPSMPALLPDVALTRQVVGAGDFRMSIPVPRGWRYSENSLNEWQWRPSDQPPFGYVLRVEQVLSNRRSIAWTLERRIDELREDEQDVRVLGRTDAGLHFSYVTSNHLRHGYLRWIDLTGSDNAQVEVAVTGRARDQDGMARLIERVSAGIRLG